MAIDNRISVTEIVSELTMSSGVYNRNSWVGLSHYKKLCLLLSSRTDQFPSSPSLNRALWKTLECFLEQREKKILRLLRDFWMCALLKIQSLGCSNSSHALILAVHLLNWERLLSCRQMSAYSKQFAFTGQRQYRDFTALHKVMSSVWLSPICFQGCWSLHRTLYLIHFIWQHPNRTLRVRYSRCRWCFDIRYMERRQLQVSQHATVSCTHCPSYIYT